MIEYKKIANYTTDYKMEKKSCSQQLVTHSLYLFLPKSDLAIRLKFFDRFFNYIKLIALYLTFKNKLTIDLLDNLQTNDVRLLKDLLVHYGLVKEQSNRFVFNSSISKLSTDDKYLLDKLIQNGLPMKFSNRKLRKWGSDFCFIRELVKRYRNHSYILKNIRYDDVWCKMIEEGKLDYEIRLSETLFELRHFMVGEKINSPFDESYYTESGRNAFKNFTRHKFSDVLNEMDKSHDMSTILDIGCGYGNYIDAVAQWNTNARIHGVEMQESVFSETQKRFAQNAQIQIFNQSIFNLDSAQKYDVILLNYVLFYFSSEEKIKLFEKIDTLLNPNGIVIICQYYSKIESLKYELAKRQREFTFSKKMEMFVGNKILYANSLWNETASTFSEAEDWLSFESILKSTGFAVDLITNADRFYYSLFIVVKKNKI